MCVFSLSNNYFRSESRALSQWIQMRIGFGILWNVDYLILTFIHFRQRNLIVSGSLVLGRLYRRIQNTSFTSGRSFWYSILKSIRAIFNKNRQMLRVVPPPSSISFFLLRYICFVLCVYVCVCLQVHGMVSWCACHHPRAMWGSWHSLPAIWTLGIKLRLSGLAVSSLTHWATSSVPLSSTS